MTRVPYTIKRSRECQRCGKTYTGARIFCSPECRAAHEVSRALAPRLWTVVFECTVDDGTVDDAPVPDSVSGETVLLQYQTHTIDSEEIIDQATADLKLRISAHVCYQLRDIIMEPRGTEPGDYSKYPSSRLIQSVADTSNPYRPQS